MKKLYYVSDTHLEFYKKPFSIVDESPDDYLALLGDIGHPHKPLYEKFLADCSGKFKEVLVVAGNHEYYGGNNKQWKMSDIDAKISNIVEKYPNITFLNNKTKVISETLFVGTTLWTDIKEKGLASKSMNDYQNIYTESAHDRDYYKDIGMSFGGQIKKKRIKKWRRLIKPDDVVNFHHLAIEFLKREINTSENVVVLSHHAPSFKLLENAENPLSDCYASDLEYLFEKNVGNWLFGHLHYNITKTIGYTECSSNCLGYKGENVVAYQKDKYIYFK